MKNIYDYTFNELQEQLVELGCQKFRAKQIYSWMYQSLVTDFDEMKNLDKKTLEILNEHYFIPKLKIIREQKDENTTKVLFELHDKHRIESVLMKYNYGNSVCVTTQVGCKIGCSFCASHLGGFIRNLSGGEIISQIVHFQRMLNIDDKRVSHIVIMGIGEPLDNLENIFGFIDIANDEKALNIGARHITLSTSGIAPKIIEVAKYPKQINLALSLHAPNDELRSKIMKINNVYNIQYVMGEIKEYIRITNRRVSIEYILLSGVNTLEKHAYELCKLLRGLNVHVNLIPYNPVAEFSYKRPEMEEIYEFMDILEDQKIQVTLRMSKGKNIDGACGQLRLNNESN